MSNTTQTKDKPETSEQSTQQKPTVLEEDDEFEDFPVEGEHLSNPAHGEAGHSPNIITSYF
jgi:hypothetical protein